MKRTLLLLLALFSLIGINAKERTLSEKQQAAANILFGSNPQARAKAQSVGTTIKLLKEMPQVSILGYNQGGFAIIANDDKYPAVLGYSQSSYTDKMPDGLEWWLGEMNKALSSPAPRPAVLSQVPAKFKPSVDPLIGTKWGQDSPFNNLCPNHYPSGCVATAMSQLMWYYKYPTHGEGYVMDFDQAIFVDFSTTTYDYDNMLQTYTKGSYSTKQADAVATLMYHAGVASKMNYANGGSGTNYYDAAVALRDNFCYNKNIAVKSRMFYDDEDWMNMIYGELSNGRPIMYAGADSTSGGHAFVFEGYDTNGNVYVNWGWDGSSDGYYNVNLLKPESTSYNFNESQNMIVGAAKPDVEIPEDCSIGAVNDLKLSVSSDKLVWNIYKEFYIYNLNVSDYKGVFDVIAEDKNGVPTILQNETGIEIPYGSGVSYVDQDVDIDVSDLADGTYRIYLAAQEDGSDKIYPFVFVPGTTKDYTLVKSGTTLTLTANTTTGIDKVTTPTHSPYTYIYNMQGQEVYKAKTSDFNMNDVPGTGIYLMKQGNKTVKVIK